MQYQKTIKFSEGLKDINYIKKEKRPILCWALQYYWSLDTSLIETLLEKGANPDLGHPSAIHVLVRNRCEGI